MINRPTERELERAKLDGEAARRAGQKRRAAAWRFGAERAELLNEAWIEGWEREDARRKAGVR